jgi:hypothetical protein
LIVNAFDLKHRSPEVKAQTLRTLATLVERYPNLRLGQLIANAIAGRDLFNIEDDELGLALNHLFVTYTQFEAAGIAPLNTQRKQK